MIGLRMMLVSDEREPIVVDVTNVKAINTYPDKYDIEVTVVFSQPSVAGTVGFEVFMSGYGADSPGWWNRVETVANGLTTFKFTVVAFKYSESYTLRVRLKSDSKIYVRGTEGTMNIP